MDEILRSLWGLLEVFGEWLEQWTGRTPGGERGAILALVLAFLVLWLALRTARRTVRWVRGRRERALWKGIGPRE